MSTERRKYVPLAGYSDRLSVRPSQTIEFKVSVQSGGPVDAWLTRSICADPNPTGMGVIERAADDLFGPRRIDGRCQPFHPGSYGISATDHAISRDRNFEIGATVFPTLRKAAPQTIVSVGGLALRCGVDGLELAWGDRVFRTEIVLPLRTWQRVGAYFDAASQSIVLMREPLSGSVEERAFDVSKGQSPASTTGRVVVAAEFEAGLACRHFNGKIEMPFFHGGAGSDKIVWDFSRDIPTTVCTASSGRKDDLRLVNFPARGMTGST